METIARTLIKHKKLVIAIFVLLAALGGVLMLGVGVNYNMADYLPEKTPSTVAIDVMKEEYDSAIPNLRVMVPDVTIPEALELREQFLAIDGVEEVMWLDDYVNVKVPLATLDADTVEAWYLDGTALFSLVVEDDTIVQSQVLDDLREIVGDEGAMSGSAVDSVAVQRTSGAEMSQILTVIVPLCLGILFLATKSWFEPILFMGNVGIAILINMGSNIFLGEISFITQTTAAILQLACSMDYSIFLLERFEEFRHAGYDPDEALVQSVSKSASSIAASGLTTVMGFAALMVMQLRIGADMGFVLAKGIACSLITTLVFMPCLTSLIYPLIDKTSHRSFLPSFKNLGIAVDKVKKPVAVLIIVALVPSFLASQNLSFFYGNASVLAPDAPESLEANRIDETFGESNTFVLLVPKGNMANETALANDIKNMKEVSGVMSFAETVGNAIPEGFLPEDTLSQLNSDTYTRVVVTTKVASEGDAAFKFVEQLRDLCQGYYPDEYHLVGETATVYDMKDTITSDTLKVNMLTIGSIFLILLLTFRSLTLPVVLLLTIESAIYINFAVPYFMGSTLNYIGYLIISSVSLGATVDYAILFTNRYYENRAMMPKKQAAQSTIADTASSIFTSGGILFVAGMSLGFISSNGIISQLGVLLGRGAAFSVISVLVFLPTQLTVLEPLIKRTSQKITLYEGEDPSSVEKKKKSDPTPKKKVKA